MADSYMTQGILYWGLLIHFKSIKQNQQYVNKNIY